MEGAKSELKNDETNNISHNEREIELFFEDLAQRQKNLLPPDLITNDRHTDDVLWHGPSIKSPIQRAGVAIFGATFVILAVSLALILWDKGGRVVLIVPTFFSAIGLRMLYKSVVGRKTRLPTEDQFDSERIL